MWQDKDLVRLRHMLDHAREAVGLIQNKSRADLTSDRLLGLALVRLMEIIGEAANRVSLEYQSQHPSIVFSDRTCKEGIFSLAGSPRPTQKADG
ncbi:MAG: hypothetical protein P8X49_12940 [Syntrophobacterales bacterium]